MFGPIVCLEGEGYVLTCFVTVRSETYVLKDFFNSYYFKKTKCFKGIKFKAGVFTVEYYINGVSFDPITPPVIDFEEEYGFIAFGLSVHHYCILPAMLS